MAVDLHIHSVFSDGTLTPEQIVEVALGKKLKVIALTDHDTVGGVARAEQAAAGTGLLVVPAVEISAEQDNADVHILGYFIDIEDAKLREKLRAIRAVRLERARTIADKLAKLGIEIDFEKLLAEAGPDSIGRPHIATRLLREGYVSSAQEAFTRYLQRGRPAYEERYRLTPVEAIELVIAAGGLPVLAHPGLQGAERRIDELAGCGLQGVEAYHIHHSPAQARQYVRMAEEQGLLVTGGSDSHGPAGPVPVESGAADVPDECAQRLVEWAERHQPAWEGRGEVWKQQYLKPPASRR